MLKTPKPIDIDEWPNWPGPSPRMKGKKLRIHGGVLQVHEADATVLLWAYPKLLGWPRDIVWVLAYASGGPDLVGIDERGELLIIETKSASKKKADPLAQLEGYLEFREFHNADALEAKWDGMWQKEQDALRLDPQDFEEHAPLPGVVPWGSKRRACAYWPKTYREKIQGFLFGEYAERAQAYLGARNAMTQPTPPWGVVVFHVTSGKPDAVAAKHADSPRSLKSVSVARIFACTLEIRERDHGKSVTVQSRPIKLTDATPLGE